MTQTDRYDNALSTQSDDARQSYVAGVDGVLGATYGTVQAFERAVLVDPGFALGHVGLARAHMMSGDMAAARIALRQAETLRGGLSERELAHIDLFGLLLSGQASQCRAAVREHVLSYPRDAMVAQLCTNVFGLIGFSGHAGREAELLAFTNALLPHYGRDWWMMSMHALSLCETGQINAATELMDQALDLNPVNANGSHFKAHALYEAGQTQTGMSYLADWLVGYDARAVLHGHLSWHLALWALQTGDTERMWQIIDDAVAPGAAQGLPINVLTDTASILYRAELAGVDVPDERWRQISAYAGRFFSETGQSFADIHAALAHAMAGDADRLAHVIATAKGPVRDLVEPVAQGWHAIAEQDWQRALNDLTPVMASHERLGGSRAQRDLLELAYLNILLKLGHTDEARRLVRSRRPVLTAQAPVAGLDQGI